MSGRPHYTLFALLLSCRVEASPTPDAGTTDSFWDELAICGEPAEAYTTITEAAAAADKVIVGRIVNAELGRTLGEDAEDTFYAETNLTVEVDKTLRGSAEPTVEVSLILANARRDQPASTIETLRAALPAEQVLLLLRKRNDLADHPNLHRTLGGDQGLWTRTTRAALDNPIAADTCGGHFGDELVTTFLEGNDTLPKLIAFLEPSKRPQM